MEVNIMTFDEIQEDLKKRLPEKRYRHTLGVCTTAEFLAKIYHLPLEPVSVAALLHDCAKESSDEEILRLCDQYGLSLTQQQRQALPALHAKLGEYYARTRYGITDPDILNAISYHTTGRPGMSNLEKVIFVADYIEPGRAEAPRLGEIRALASQSLEEAICMIYEDTISYLKQKKAVIDPTTLDAYRYYISTGNQTSR